MIIQAVTLECIPEVLTFVLNARAELFPKLSARGVPDDLARFDATYIQGAIDFWVRQGFSVIDVDPDPVWQTTHLHRPL